MAKRTPDDYRARRTLTIGAGGRTIGAGDRIPDPKPLPDAPETVDGQFIHAGRRWRVTSAHTRRPLEAEHVTDERTVLEDMIRRGLVCPPEGCGEDDCGRPCEPTVQL